MSREVRMKRNVILSVLTAVLAWPAQSQPSKGAHTAAEIEPLLAKISAYEYGADPAPAIQFDELVADLQSSPDARRALEARLLQFVQSKATAAGKEAGFRALARIGTDASVPVLSPMLTRAETAEWARYALGAIPGEAVNEAF